MTCVSSISLLLRARSRALGAPNQSMVGGPPSHSAIKRGCGSQLAVRGSPRRHTPHPTNPNQTRGSTVAAGSSATAAAEDILLDSTYTVPPVDARPHRVVLDPPLPPLHQAAAAPVTTTETASDSTPASNPDGLHSLNPLCSFVSSLRCRRSR
jgi:hypothetical protein